MGSSNGQKGFINEDETYLNKGNTISFGQDTATMFYQEKPYFTGDKIKILKSKYNRFNKKNALFFIETMRKSFSSFSWGGSSFSIEIIGNQLVTLPIKNNKIDFDFMESFISQIEAERIEKLEAYLEASGLKDYVLTDEEQKVLDDFKNEKIDFGEFKIEKLFEINSYKKRFDANKVIISEIGKPYVVRTALNNGVRGYINEDEKFLNDGNTISFGQDTATMFYQEKPYFTGDKIKILKSKDDRFNKLNGLFFISTMTKSFSSFSWGGSSFNVKIIGDQLMKLPIENQQPNYKIMETLISAIQKLVIKDVVLYVDNKVGA